MRHSAVSRYHWFSGRMSAEFNVIFHRRVLVFSTNEIETIASRLAEEHTGNVTETSEAFLVEIAKDARQLWFEWRKDNLAEVWLTFAESGKDIYQSWAECMVGDDKASFVEYVCSIPALFLNNEIRVAKYGLIFRGDILEYRHSNKWRSVLGGKT